MNDKTVIVTGANSGMGLATTIELARKGARVIMACRSAQRGEAARGEAIRRSGSTSIELMILDLGSLTSIRKFAAAFNEKYTGLDVLVNNAGVASLRREITEDGFEVMLGVNHLGHFLLTNLLLPALERSPEGRIINVSSGAYKVGRIHFEDPHLTKGFNIAKGYAQSKLANILFTRELAVRLKGSTATTNCLHPGAVGTSIGVDRQTGFGKTILAMLRPFFLTPAQGAETAVYLATSAEVKEISGEYFYKKQLTPLPDKVKDPQLSSKFWAWSEHEVKL
ncbi:MAG: SDR family oxidoreductase [Gorillibacterium sp.]|nr:SDR family oxidoreductase [Gorillibacterium sp.]